MRTNSQAGLYYAFLILPLLLMMPSAVFAVEDATTISPDDFPYGYPFPEYPTAGASHPGVSADYMGSEPNPGDIKRIGQYALRLIQTDRESEALSYTQRYLEEHPGRLDEEMHFMKTLSLTRLGRIEDAAQSMLRAIEETQLTAQRFIAGPRRLFEPLQEHAAFQRLLEQHRYDLVHGPMLGKMTENSVAVWVRTAAEMPVYVTISQSPDLANPVTFGPAFAKAADDYTTIVDINDLEVDTAYYYMVLLGEEKVEVRTPYQQFRTFPATGTSAAFRVVFGGCAGYDGLERERVWKTVVETEPLAVLMLGDNVYIDDPESSDQQRYCYYQRYSVPEYRAMQSSRPMYGIWDDHDFAMDDSEGGPEIDIPYWKPMVWEIFRQNWNNPKYGGGKEQPGVWFDFQIADVHFIMLDGRYYREDGGRWSGGEGVENPSMLGPVQMAWLKETFTQSDATFKVLASPVPWNYDAKGEGARRYDGWYGYAQEREEIFSWIDTYDISGVFLLSGDRHRSDSWKINSEHSYDLFEFASAHFTNIHTHGIIEGSLFGYNEKNSFGLLHFDTRAEPPMVKYQIINVDGEVMGEIALELSQLQKESSQ